jgi:hypothetical protein
VLLTYELSMVKGKDITTPRKGMQKLITNAFVEYLAIYHNLDSSYSSASTVVPSALDES